MGRPTLRKCPSFLESAVARRLQTRLAMPRLSLPQLGRITLLGGAALALIASTQEGERAGGDGVCPAGETCAPETPQGLLFEGVPLGFWPDATAHTIAAGGRQTFRITDKATGAPLALPFRAEVTAAGHRLFATGAERAVVEATAADTGYLRILSPSGELYDRVIIDSAELGSVGVLPTYAYAYPALMPARWAAYAGARVEVAVTLATADGGWLVDEGLAITAALPLERVGWDAVALTAPAGAVTLTVDAGGRSGHTAAFDVVDRVDELRPSSARVDRDKREATVCFHASTTVAAGGAVTVVGVPTTYRVTGPAQPLATQRYPSCLELRLTAATGEVVVEATAAGRSATRTFRIEGDMARRAPAMTAWLFAPTEGERAATAGD